MKTFAISYPKQIKKDSKLVGNRTIIVPYLRLSQAYFQTINLTYDTDQLYLTNSIEIEIGFASELVGALNCC